MAQPDPSASMDGRQIPSTGLEEVETQHIDSEIDAERVMQPHDQVKCTIGHR